MTLGRDASIQRKMGKGKISTEAFASILAHSGKPIFRKMSVAGGGGRFFAISPELNLCSLRTPHSMSTRVEFLTAARACVCVKRRTRAAAAENSCTAAQHFAKAPFLPKPTEPPLTKKHLTDCLRA
jgi:hypothetical protein